MAIRDPLLHDDLVQLVGDGLDLLAAFDFAREPGAEALPDLTFGQRARGTGVLRSHPQAGSRAVPYISIENSDTTMADSIIDVDAANVPLQYFAKVAPAMETTKYLRDRNLTGPEFYHHRCAIQGEKASLDELKVATRRNC